MSPGWTIERMSARKRILAVERARIAMAARTQPLDQGVAVGAFDRRFAGRIDIGDDHRVRLVEAGAELGEEILQPRIAVRLDDCDETALRHRARGLQHRSDLDRVMAVIVID